MNQLAEFKEYLENWDTSRYIPNGSQNTLRAIADIINPTANLSCSTCVSELLDDAYNRLQKEK